MRLIELIRNSLTPNGVTKTSVGLGHPSLEQYAKLATGASVACFAIGVTCTAIFYASVSLRPFEPLNVQQVFLGFLFLLYASIAFVIPTRMGPRSPLSWLIQVAAVSILLVDNSVVNHVAYYLGAKVVHLNEEQFASIVLTKVNGLLLFCAAATAFRLLAAWLVANPKGRTVNAMGGLLVAVVLSLAAFGKSAYPRIPFALGGGDFPVVQIHFKESAPYILTSEFDIGPQYGGFRHYGRLVYQTSESFFLSSAFWFRSDVVEVSREYIVMLKFGDFNPTKWILPSSTQK